MSSSDSDDDMPPVLVGAKVPLTLLTGYLGAGKSTLIQYILNEEHGRRIAVIMNEFSDTADIEARAISIQSPTGATTTPLLTLPNGCLCCSSRDDGFAAIQEMVAQRGAFDYIILETTGLADPGPIAETFWRNEEWDADVRLDGVVTMVDGMWGLKQMKENPEVEGEPTEWEKQIACADVLLLNKIDDASPELIIETESAIKSINSHAPLHKTSRSVIDLSKILDLKAYSPNPNSNPLVPSLPPTTSSSSSSPPHESHPPHAPHAPHPPQHSSISTLLTPLPSLSPEQFALFLKNIQVLLWAPETLFPDASSDETRAIPEVLRLKGIVWNSEDGGEEDRIRGWVIQGVRGVYEVEEIKSGEKEGGGEGKVVVVGRGLEGLGPKLWGENI
ncbi:CobW/HypB/UreG, nucleotide-binding domain-containing protein [Mrakia frigida]|uniref:GTP-binding protein n=1 Tax=Mrakia frigida TaxID=29902 RepID=UPI003FCC0FCB